MYIYLIFYVYFYSNLIWRNDKLQFLRLIVDLVMV